MPYSLELKAVVRDRLALDGRLLALGAVGPEILVQEDLHLNCSRGRLLLRRTEGAGAEMLAYRRDGSIVPSPARWDTSPVDDADPLADELLRHGALGVVRRWRTLYVLDGMRVHLDEHEDGRECLELVAPFEDEIAEVAARDALLGLARALGVSEQDWLRGSAADALEPATPSADPAHVQADDAA
ncbi:MAG: CYTH domain-containing protein [Planctomycetes bacterium]|nr:CYTH domain-containing protein [Planctomycetota bacterium]